MHRETCLIPILLKSSHSDTLDDSGILLILQTMSCQTTLKRSGKQQGKTQRVGITKHTKKPTQNTHAQKHTHTHTHNLI